MPLNKAQIESIKWEILADLKNRNFVFRNYALTLNEQELGERIKQEIIEELDIENMVRREPSSWFDMGQRKGFIYGAASGLLVTLLSNPVRTNLQKLATGTIEEGVGIFDRIRAILARFKEGIEDIVAEANFNSMQRAALNGQKKDLKDKNSFEGKEVH